MTKRILGIAVFTLGIALPAHAQTSRGGAVGSSANGSGVNGGGGGFGGGAGGGGFGGGGLSGASKLPSYPVSSPRMTGISGSQGDFVPSTFLPYDKALTEGKTVLDTPPPTVAEAAREQTSARVEKAKFALVQDEYGHPMIIRQ